MSTRLPLKLLVVNGCSMTFGDELADRLRTGWAALLARKLGVELINLGGCAASNHRIIRMAVERLDQYTKERGLEPEQVLFLGMWSRVNRYEFFAGEEDRQTGLPDEYPDPGWCRVHPAYIERRDKRTISFYRDLHNDEADKREFLAQWVMFEGWLAGKGYNHGYLWAFDPDPDIFLSQSHLTRQLDFTRVIGGDRLPYGGPSIFSVGQSLDDLGPRLHPLERSQQYFLDNYLYDWVCGLLSLESVAPVG